jgi:hypothetical protein
MSVQQDLLNFCDLSTFTIPIEWVASALDLSSRPPSVDVACPLTKCSGSEMGTDLFTGF